MDRLRSALVGALALLLLVGDGATDEEFGPEQARALLPAAAGTDPAIIEAARALGAKVTLKDLESAGGMPLTLVLLAYGRHDTKDFVSPGLGVTMTIEDAAGAMMPMETRDGKEVRKYAYASLILPEYVREVTCERQAGEARGTLTFACVLAGPAKNVLYEGRVEWTARRAPSGWRIEEFRLPGHGIRVLLADGIWRAEDLAHPGKPPPRLLTAPEFSVPVSVLPRVAGAGPMPADPVVIGLGARGLLSLKSGDSLERGSSHAALDGLRRELKTIAFSAPAVAAQREADGAWKRNVVLRVAPSVPWEVATWVMAVCGDPTIKAYRLHFAVLPEKGDEVAALAAFLPRDGGTQAQPVNEPAHLRLTVLPHERVLDPAVALAACRKLLATRPGAAVELHAELGVAAGHVIRLTSLLGSLGAQEVLYRMVAPPPGAGAGREAGGLEPYVKEHPAFPGYALLLGEDETLVEAQEPAPGR